MALLPSQVEGCRWTGAGAVFWALQRLRASRCLALLLSHIGRQQPGSWEGWELKKAVFLSLSLKLTAGSVSVKAHPALLAARALLRLSMWPSVSKSSGRPFDFIPVLAACLGQFGDS